MQNNILKITLLVALMLAPAVGFADGGPSYGGGYTTGSQYNPVSYGYNTQAQVQPSYYSGNYAYPTSVGTGVQYDYNQNNPYAYNYNNAYANNQYANNYANPATGMPLQNQALQNSWTLNMPIQTLLPLAIAKSQPTIANPQVVGFENFYTVSIANGLPSYYGMNATEGLYTIYGGERYGTTTVSSTGFLPVNTNGNNSGSSSSNGNNNTNSSSNSNFNSSSSSNSSGNSNSNTSGRSSLWPFDNADRPITGNLPW